MLLVLASARIAKDFADFRKSQLFVEFTIGDQSRIARDGCAVELQLDPTVKFDPSRVLACATHWMLLLGRD